MKKLKEEQATVEQILAMLKDGKDVRKGDWTSKQVCSSRLHPFLPCYKMTKSDCSLIPAL